MDGPGTVAGHDDSVGAHTWMGVLAWLQKRLIPLLYVMKTAVRRDSTLDRAVDEPELTVQSAWCAFSEVRNMSTELRWRDRTLRLALSL